MTKIGYKIAHSRYDRRKYLMVKLAIPDNAKTNSRRSSIVNRRFAKLRCDTAKVLDIYDPIKPHIKRKHAGSNWNSKFIYTVGETLKIDNYNDNISKICAPGIHYFESEEAAQQYARIRNKTYIEHHDDDGRLLHKRNYLAVDSNLLHGEQVTYNDFGNIMWISNYKNGNRHGDHKLYCNKKLVRHSVYNNGTYVRKLLLV